MGGKCEFVSLTKLAEVDDAELERLKTVIATIIAERSAELAIIAFDPKEYAGLKVIMQPKKDAEKKS
jgi:CRISPR/Cas system-associated endoribonuclease Cas2